MHQRLVVAVGFGFFEFKSVERERERERERREREREERERERFPSCEKCLHRKSAGYMAQCLVCLTADEQVLVQTRVCPVNICLPSFLLALGSFTGA